MRRRMKLWKYQTRRLRFKRIRERQGFVVAFVFAARRGWLERIDANGQVFLKESGRWPW